MEVVVVDDCSDKDAFSKSKSFCDNIGVNLLRNPKNSGSNYSRNHGLRNSSGQYILFHDSDDLVEPNFFDTLVPALKSDNDLAGVYTNWGYIDSQDVLLSVYDYPIYSTPQNKMILLNQLKGKYIPIHGILWRKNFLDEIEGFDESVKINQDVDLLIRSLIAGHKFIGVRGTKALVRQHAGPRVGSANSSEKLIQILKLRKKYIQLLQADKMFTSDLKQAIAHFLFYRWWAWRSDYPTEAKQFLELYREIGSSISLQSKPYLNIIAKIIGPDKALVGREAIRRTIGI